MSSKVYFISDVGWLSLDQLHERIICFTNPEESVLYKLEDQVSCLVASESLKDLFTESMYAIPDDHVGYHSLYDIEELGYSTSAPNAFSYTIGDSDVSHSNVIHTNSILWTKVVIGD